MNPHFKKQLNSARARRSEEELASFHAVGNEIVEGLRQWEDAKGLVLKHTSSDFVTALGIPNAPPFDDGWQTGYDISFPFVVEDVSFSLAYDPKTSDETQWKLSFWADAGHGRQRADGGRTALPEDWNEDDLWDRVAEVFNFLDSRSQL